MPPFPGSGERIVKEFEETLTPNTKFVYQVLYSTIAGMTKAGEKAVFEKAEAPVGQGEFTKISQQIVLPEGLTMKSVMERLNHVHGGEGNGQGIITGIYNAWLYVTTSEQASVDPSTQTVSLRVSKDDCLYFYFDRNDGDSGKTWISVRQSGEVGITQ